MSGALGAPAGRMGGRGAPGAVAGRAGEAGVTAGRAETWRDDFVERVARHRAAIRSETDRLGWSFTIHRTDRPPSELLLALHARIAADASELGLHAPTSTEANLAASDAGSEATA